MKLSNAVFCGLLMVAALPLTALAATNSSQVLAVHYNRDGSTQAGEFRRSAEGWGETFPDIVNPPRHWSEVANSPAGKLRLTSLGATIEIDFATEAINYTDGKSPFRRLDTITSIEEISAISYVRDGTTQNGEFRRSAAGWSETFPDIVNPPRHWTEVASSAGTLRLTSSGATVDITFANRAINYSDGHSASRRLDTITSVE
jgi:hypothetical protein